MVHRYLPPVGHFFSVLFWFRLDRCPGWIAVEQSGFSYWLGGYRLCFCAYLLTGA